MARCLVAALFLAFVAPMVAAAAEAEPNPAVGRLNHAGYSKKRHCTFVAVAPRVALTAAHCVDDLPVDELHLLFGYQRMSFAAKAGVAEVHRLGRDSAALCLGSEAPAWIPIGGPVARNDTVQLVGYGVPRVHLQQSNTCKVWTPVGDEILLDCASAPGSSGAPVLDGAGEVVAVVSRTGRGSSYAVSVSVDAVQACEHLGDAQPGEG
ncbi:MAG: trypsin-like peptidase domain-containing protein [Pseudomonadota bacterium]